MRPETRPPAGPSIAALSTGELSPEEAAALEALGARLRGRFGFDCGSYKQRCFRRRVAVRMRARGMTSFVAYAGLLEAEQEEQERLLASLTINVSKFLRNPDVWRVVEDRILPELLQGSATRRVWSAGSAGGEEAYTLAMLVREAADRLGRPELVRRFDIVGTDVDAAVVAGARKAEFPGHALDELEGRRRSWFTDGPPHRLDAALRDMVRFEVRDLLREPCPAPVDLILCRNVFIYFERAAQEALLERFRDALCPGGFLVLGKVEMLVGPAATAFRPVANRERVFRKS